MARKPATMPDRPKLEGKLSPDIFRDEISDRHREILEAAAVLFAERGFAATSVRDIGEKVGLLGGSLYHYIRSKEALFVRIHDLALQTGERRLREAITRTDDPWERLTAACVTMLDIQLDPHSLTMPLMNDLRSVPAEVRDRLVERRDTIDRLYADVIADLPLPPETDRALCRLLLLTLLNNISGWYRAGRLTPEDIGRQISAIFRGGMADQPAAR